MHTPIRQATFLGLLIGCASSPTPPEPEAKEEVVEAQPNKSELRETSETKPGTPDAPTVIFIVLDTVRADHLSACGYHRPTSPYLEELSKQSNVAWRCDGVSPATWTIPTHASFFTGLTVPEHHADAIGIPMPDDSPVLAEQFVKRGYQTVMVSANPTLREDSGLQRGFEHVRVAKSLTKWRGDRLVWNTTEELRSVDPKKPLFLFVNLIDAHDPYPVVPKGLDWVAPQPRLLFKNHAKDKDQPYHDYILGKMSKMEAYEYLTLVENGYDYGIRELDETLRNLMKSLEDNGNLRGDYRIIITSDHGEFLGEHQLLRHGCYTWEPVINVPFLYIDSQQTTPMSLPSPLSTVNAYALALDGKIESPAPALSFSKRRKVDIKKGEDMVSLRKDDTQKWIWYKGDLQHIDLAKDPDELHPTPLKAPSDQTEFLVNHGEAHAAHLKASREITPDQETIDALEALGYVE